MNPTDEYAFVGPCLFVMRNHPEMAEAVWNWNGREPEHEEVWIEIHCTWVRLDGQWISGWSEGEHFGFRPNWLNRWKIRRAARAWRRDSGSGRDGGDANAAPGEAPQSGRASGIAHPIPPRKPA